MNKKEEYYYQLDNGIVFQVRYSIGKHDDGQEYCHDIEFYHQEKDFTDLLSYSFKEEVEEYIDNRLLNQWG